MMITYVKLVLFNKSFMWLLFIVNLFGTIYGYYWYESSILHIQNQISSFCSR